MRKTVLFAIALSGSSCFLRGNLNSDQWTAEFPVEPGEFSSTGRNPYFVLEPGHTLVLADGADQLTITVLPETKMIGAVETRVVEERELEDGELVEVSRNFFAISKRTNSVYYFGETVDNYKDGKIVNHDGAWLAGENGARFGMLMPGVPLIGGRHYQEIAPGIAMDRAEIISVSDTMTVPAGAMKQVLKVRESSPLEPGIKEYKYYAPGVGLLKDGDMKLVTYGVK
jgi:hypothetical protein